MLLSKEEKEEEEEEAGEEEEEEEQVDVDDGVGDEDERLRSLASEMGGLKKGSWKWCEEGGEEEEE